MTSTSNHVVQLTRNRVHTPRPATSKAAQLASQALLADLPAGYHDDMRFALSLADELDPHPARAHTALLVLRQVVADLAGVPVDELMRRFGVPAAKSTSHL